MIGRTGRTLGLVIGVAASTAALRAQPAMESPITIGVSPPRFEVELGSSPTVHAVRVFNFAELPVEIQTSVRGWELDVDNKVRIVAPTEQSLDQWIVINPLRFTIPPGNFQTVRFSIRPKVPPAPGEHRAMIYFEQPVSQRESIRVQGRMGIAVYAHVGSVERVGTLNGVAVEEGGRGQVARFDVSSLGSAHVRLAGQYAVWPAAIFPGAGSTSRIDDLGEEGVVVPPQIVNAGFLPGLPVLPGSRRSLPLYLPPGLPEGEYVLDINGDLSGAPVDLAVPFTIASRDAPRAAAD